MLTLISDPSFLRTVIYSNDKAVFNYVASIAKLQQLIQPDVSLYDNMYRKFVTDLIGNMRNIVIDYSVDNPLADFTQYTKALKPEQAKAVANIIRNLRENRNVETILWNDHNEICNKH